ADKKACESQSSKPPTSQVPSKPASGLLGSKNPQDDATALDSPDNGEDPVPNPACDRIPADKTAVLDAKRVVLSSETALDAAQERQRVDQATGRVSIENAKQSVVSGQNDLDTAGSDRPADTSVQESVVRDAEAQVALAQRDLDNIVLRAPVAAVVSAVNGAPGEFVAAASGTTAMAPGSSAALPDGAAVSSGSGGAGASTPAPGGGAFIVLNNIDSFQLVVPFEESDAARVSSPRTTTACATGRPHSSSCSPWTTCCACRRPPGARTPGVPSWTCGVRTARRSRPRSWPGSPVTSTRR
ncbi:MAG: HlyD family secretion protein, partial [Pseudonocardiales bacterium]|nr:HlyD family secretion protein [Pseudonocardiales bacterium]